MGGRNEQRGEKKMNVQNAMQEIKRGKKKKEKKKYMLSRPFIPRIRVEDESTWMTTM